MVFEFLRRGRGGVEGAAEVKASATGRLFAYQGAGRVAWSPRDTASLSRAGFVGNPVGFRAVKLIAEAGIPVYVIHGTDDRVVPIDRNSAELESAYQSAGNADAITLERVDGQGHNFWEGFFRSQKLIDFLITEAKGD